MVIKVAGSIVVLMAMTALGMVIAKTKNDRVKQLRALISALNMLEIEIKFALSVLPDAFIKISKTIDNGTRDIFYKTADLIKSSRMDACEAWCTALNQITPNLCISSEDREILSTLGNTLGETDSENQIKSIRLIVEQLKRQETKAEEDKVNGEKLFKSLGVLSGLTIVIILF